MTAEEFWEEWQKYRPELALYVARRLGVPYHPTNTKNRTADVDDVLDWTYLGSPDEYGGGGESGIAKPRKYEPVSKEEARAWFYDAVKKAFAEWWRWKVRRAEVPLQTQVFQDEGGPNSAEYNLPDTGVHAYEGDVSPRLWEPNIPESSDEVGEDEGLQHLRELRDSETLSKHDESPHDTEREEDEEGGEDTEEETDPEEDEAPIDELLEEEPTPSEQEDAFACPQCGRTPRRRRDRCSKCGLGLRDGKSICPACDKELEPQWEISRYRRGFIQLRRGLMCSACGRGFLYHIPPPRLWGRALPPHRGHSFRNFWEDRFVSNVDTAWMWGVLLTVMEELEIPEQEREWIIRIRVFGDSWTRVAKDAEYTKARLQGMLRDSQTKVWSRLEDSKVRRQWLNLDAERGHQGTNGTNQDAMAD